LVANYATAAMRSIEKNVEVVATEGCVSAEVLFYNRLDRDRELKGISGRSGRCFVKQLLSKIRRLADKSLIYR
jgi:hypothetical protein